MSSSLTNDENRPCAVPIGKLLLEGFRWFDRSLVMSMMEAGLPPLTSAQSLVFPSLDAGGTSISELARRIGVTRQAAHQNVRELVRKGLLHLEHDPLDRRAQLIRLTARGAQSVEMAKKLFAELERTLALRIGEDPTSALRAALSSDWGEPVTVTV